MYRPPGSWQKNSPQLNGGRVRFSSGISAGGRAPSQTLSATLPPGSPYTHQYVWQTFQSQFGLPGPPPAKPWC